MRTACWTIGVLMLAGGASLAAPVGGPPDAASDGKKAEPPPAFSKLTLAEALDKAKAAEQKGKVVIADFTAEWCAPCKMMDRTVWRDPNVEEWIKDHAIAVQVDVDASRDVAIEQHVSAMPTIIVFKDGEMVDRRTGSTSAGQLTMWLNTALTGKKPGETDTIVLPEGQNGGQREDGADKVSMEDRLRAARALIDRGALEKATAEYVWLWQNIAVKDPAMSGVRGSFMAGDMQRLAQVHRPARGAFAQERDTLEARLKGPDRTFQDLDDWIVLNKVVGDEDRTLAWVDRIKNDADAGPTLTREFFRVRDLLVSKERWADVGKLEADPVGELKRAKRMWAYVPRQAKMDPEMRKHIEDLNAQMLRDEAAVLYASQLAAGNDAKAKAVLDEAIKIDGSGAMRSALVSKALEARQARRAQLDVLDRVDDGTDVKALREKVMKALGEGAG